MVDFKFALTHGLDTPAVTWRNQKYTIVYKSQQYITALQRRICLFVCFFLLRKVGLIRRKGRNEATVTKTRWRRGLGISLTKFAWAAVLRGKPGRLKGNGLLGVLLFPCLILSS